MGEHVERGVHEREMRERLREVAEEPLLHRVVLLREQAEVVRKPDKAVEERVRVVVPTGQLIAIDEPERARQKYALARRKAVDAVMVGAVAQDEPVLQEIVFDRLDRAADPR